MEAEGYHTRMKRPHVRREDLGITSGTQPGASFIPNPAEPLTDEATGEATLPFPALSPIGGAELAGEGHQDA